MSTYNNKYQLQLETGQLIQAAALSADPRAHRSRDTIRMRAVWRSGDGLNVIVFPEGNAYDHVTGESYSAKRMGELLGVSVSGGRKPPSVPTPKRKEVRMVDEAGIHEVWERSQDPAGKLDVARKEFLLSRGVATGHEDIGVIDGKVGAATRLGQWVAGKSRSAGCPLLVVPLRDAAGEVRSLAFRVVGDPREVEADIEFNGTNATECMNAIYGTRPKSDTPKLLFPPRDLAPLSDDNGLSYLYGDAHRIASARVVVVTEGWGDWLAVHQLLGREVCAVGVRDCNSYIIDSYFSASKARVVLAPDADKPDNAWALGVRLKESGHVVEAFDVRAWANDEREKELEHLRAAWSLTTDKEARERIEFKAAMIKREAAACNDIGDVLRVFARKHHGLGGDIEHSAMDGSIFRTLVFPAAAR